MASIAIIGKKGSKSRKDITDNTGIKLYRGQKVDAILNYGAAGNRMRRLQSQFSSIKRIPVINRYAGHSKYSVVTRARDRGILAPKSKLSLGRGDRTGDWIEKRVNSSQGKGIRKARGKSRIAGKYYQEMISDRRFELRVHSFLWIPTSDWVIHKRLGPADQIAWNFHQGGHFQRVMYPNKYDVFLEAKDMATAVLNMCRMAFGAVDFIVDNNMKVYFIEVNAAPGFTELSQNIYFNAMSKLKDMTKRQLGRYSI